MQMTAANRAVELANNVEMWFPHMETRADWVNLITVLVIVFGALPAVLTLSKRVWVKTVVAVLAALVSILTAFKAQILNADKENFRSILVEAQDVVAAIRTEEKALKASLALNPGGLSPDEANVFTTSFNEEIHRLSELKKRALILDIPLLAPPPHAAKGTVSWWSPVVYAAGQTPDWTSASDQASLMAVGNGACNTTFGAREYARYEARRLIVRQIDPKASPERVVQLMAGIDNVVRDMRNQLWKDAKTGIIMHRAEASLDRALTSSKYLNASGRDTAEARWEGVATLPVGFQGRAEVKTKAGVREGNFVFVVDVKQGGGKGTVALKEIQVFDDSSSGSTRWYFDVQVNGKRVFRMPTHRLEDQRKPTTCVPAADEGLTGGFTADARQRLTIEVLGFKPKDM